MRINIMLAALILTGGTAAAQGEDPQLAFNNHCRTCHSQDEGDNRLGPSLHGVIGRTAGTLEGYEFSSSMRSSNVTWDEETLDAFIENPDAVVSGHAMRPYPGVADPAVRAAIIEALRDG